MKTNLPTRLLRLGFVAALFCALITGGDLRADLTLSGGAGNPVASVDEAVIAEALSAATSRIESFATTDPEAFATVLRQAFGQRLSPEVERHFVEKAAQRQLPLPARILFVPDEILDGAYAAYAREEGGILFLAASYRGKTEALTTFLLHEWGHHLDALLGEGDSPMDEGMVFALGIEHGGEIPAAYTYLTGAHMDDHRVITFEGRSFLVECFFKKLWGGIKKAASAVANVAVAAVNTVADVGGDLVSLVGNAGKAVGNGLAGLGAGIASGIAHATGNSKLGDSIAAESRKQFSGSFNGLKGAANDAVGSIARRGDLYNKTLAEFNKVVPHLGTAMGIAAGFTPAGPALAFVKGVADVKSVVENGGDAGAIMGAIGFAALDYGGAKLGRVAGGIKGAKAAGATAKAAGTAASTGGKIAAKAPGFFGKVGNLVKTGGKKFANGIKAATKPITKATDKIKAGTTESWKWTKATADEISKGRSLLTNSSWKGTAIEYGKKLDTFVRPKDFIPGRDRDKTDGRLLGTGGNEWQNHANSVADGATEKWNQARDMANENWNKARDIVQGGNTGVIRPATKVIPVVSISTRTFMNLADQIRRSTTNLTSLAPSNSRTINQTAGVGTPVNTAPAAPVITSLLGRVYGQDDKGNTIGVIPGAKIELFRADKSPAGSVIANETGFYQLPGLQAGGYTYRVSANGYTADDAGRGMVIPDNPRAHVHTFTLSNNPPPGVIPSGKMTGRAWEEKDGKRTPMAGVKVIAKLESAGSGYQEGFTDREGVYSLTLPPGMWKASAVPIGFDSKVHPGVVTVPDNASATADFVFSRGNATPPNAGEVTALVSVPLRSAPTTPFVKFINLDTSEATSGKTKPLKNSGESRWYETVPVTPLKVGRYRAEADFQGFPNATSPSKTVSAGQKTWFDIAFIPAKTPSDVNLTDAGNPVTPVPPVTPPAPPVIPPAPEPKPIPKPELAHTIDLTGVLVELSPSHDKAYKDGKKIPNARLTIQAPAGVTLPGILSTPLLTGTQGEFAAKALPEGTYTVSISAEGYEEFTGPLKVTSGMEPLLLSLKPRNADSDNWIRMILTEGWGDLLPSRQFHESGTKAAPGDSNVDYALGLSALQAKDKATSIPALALAVGKVSNEKWWDRACEAHLWTLMFHQETTSAVSEIRRLIAGVYGGRAESDESRDTAFLCGVAVGVLQGPWAAEGIGQLDAEITATLKGTHLTSYEAGKQSVAGRFTQLSEAETKAKKDLADAADGERTRMLAELEKRVQQLKTELDANTTQQQMQTQAFTNYRTTAEANANTHTARLTELVAQADTLRTEIAGLQQTMNSGMQAQSNRKLEELQGGLTANLAAQEAELQTFTTYRNGAEQTANNHVNRLTQISAELQQLAADFAKAQANPNPQMAGGGMARLTQIEGELSAAVNQASLLTQRINTLQEEAQAQINTYNTQLQKIVNDQTARQTRVNEINAMPPYCPVCTNFAEKPADCQDCAQVRRDREAEVIRLNQEFAQDQARDQEIRALSEGVQNNYNAAVATYNEQVAPMQKQEAILREEYNRLAGEANKTPAPNPMLAEIQKRDATLRTEYQETEAKHAALTADYSKAEADYLTKINQLKENEAALRAQMANTPAPAPGAGTEAGLIAEKTAAYTRIQQEYQDVEKQLATVQADYLSEGGKHQQEIATLTGLATTLTNQINETVAQMGNLPASGTMPAGAAPAENRPSMAFATYFDYPLEQRRQELLGWVTRGANLGTPATR